ncbi:RagB/SusD family nutrient uptake outer membrane protein [Pedobacter ginsengisoli]|uniref:RagB/SusD family nutrient uptake outer membrane protein n=1 Tax=Pedobacter ginsengisoli TaxID=363852 RepID=A0A2D1UC85_9SPHI|nr:RagB/SusD family nutrient uptake outer membrane protein [Pedobacter ginsengisoli]ATP59238.1 RagB/SusD family nutrient uptake outer membrane protein [Pedobacter ginsengisoli]
MKKITFIIITIISLSAISPGCKKLLEVKPQSSVTDEVFFKNESDFEPYVTGIYTYMRLFANNIVYGTERSEELVAALNSRFGVSWSQIITPSSGAINYNDWYKAIGHCNLLLKKIEGFSFAANPDTKKKILAETYALRAYFYFHLTRVIGDAPLMLAAVEDENVPLLPRSKAVDVLKQVQSDLDLAIQNFTSMSGFSKTAYPSKYRFAYGSAMALKADAYLWNAKVLGGGDADLAAAATTITEVEASGLTLNQDYKNVTGVRAATNPEVALAAYFQRDEAGGNYGVNALPYLTGVDGALNLDKIPYAQTSANGQGAYQISPKSRALFTNPDDKRIPYTWVTEMQASGPKISWITKYPGNIYADGRVSDNDLIIYRLSDIFLMKAEAYAGLNNIPLAIEYLNKVRQRAGTGVYSGSVVKVDVELEILNERGRELFFENKRWYDLVRFHKGGTIDVYKYVPNLVGKTTPLFWPLNTTVFANNPNIKQTDGY